MRNVLLTFIIFVSGCSILPQEYLTDLPNKFEMTRIEFITEGEFGGQTYSSANVKYLNNSIEVDFVTPLNIFYQSVPVDKILYYLNSKNFVDSIILVQTDNFRIKDRFIYNADNALIEMSNSFFNDKLKIFYKNNVMDSVYKTQEVQGGPALTGFFKKVPAGIVSIFPYNKMQTSTLTRPASCDVTGANILNKSFFSLGEYNDISSIYFTCAQNTGAANVRTDGAVSRTTALTYNGEPKETSLNSYFYSCSPFNYGLSYYSLFPGILPVESDVEVLTLEREIRVMLKNSKTIPFQKITMKYIYKPV